MTAPYPTIPGVAFKDIPGFPGYCVGDDGSAWSRKAKGGNDRSPGRLAPTWKKLSLFAHASGHLSVNLFRGGEHFILPLHRLVLEVFVGLCPEGMVACHHPDPDPSNNRVSNLRWDTHAENMLDKCRDRLALPTRTCVRCREVKRVADMATNRRKPGGIDCVCRSCKNRQTVECQRRRRAKRREAKAR